MFTKYLIKYSYYDEPNRTAYMTIVNAKNEAEARALLIKYKGGDKWLNILDVKESDVSFNNGEMIEEIKWFNSFVYNRKEN